MGDINENSPDRKVAQEFRAPTQDTVSPKEAEERGVETVQQVDDLTSFGDLETTEMGRDGDKFSANHEFLKLSGSVAHERDPQLWEHGMKPELPVSGTLFVDGQSVEQYQYEYVTIAGKDGEPKAIRGAKLTSTLDNGSTEIIERTFDQDGNVVRETDTLDGSLKKERLSTYREDGERVSAAEVWYDEEGNETLRLEDVLQEDGTARRNTVEKVDGAPKAGTEILKHSSYLEGTAGFDTNRQLDGVDVAVQRGLGKR